MISHVKLLSEEELFALRDEWNALNSESSVFTTWDWMFNWWKQNKRNEDQLIVLGAMDVNDQLCGIAPLYKHTYKIKYLPFPITCVHFLGNRFGDDGGICAEYLEFITQAENAELICDLLATHLFDNFSFSELRLDYLIEGSPTDKAFEKVGKQLQLYSRSQGSSCTWEIPCEAKFESYIQNLGKNSRLKLYNRRNKLDTLGKIEISDVNAQNFPEVCNSINSFHKERWSKIVLDRPTQNFLFDVTSLGIVELSGKILTLNGKTLAITLDLTHQQKSYNIQMGFSRDLDQHKISLGTLILGYSIEYCFISDSISHYDLLAGGGKRDNYKQHLALKGSTLDSAHIVRSPLLSLLYRAKDYLRDKQSIKKS